VERITVRGKALEGSAEIDSPDRAVTVYLPPGYAGDQKRRFPVVYLLHGAGWNETGFLEGPPRLQQSADRLAGAQGFSEFIVVTPSVSTAGKGGVYSAAWERFR
jgi:S-formylglutathione hydrolase FrmB